MDLKNPIVYFPIESRHRELSARLLQAAYLVRAGVHVVIGVGHEIVGNIDVLPPGVFLVKGLNAVQRNLLMSARRAGHLPVVIDEECLGIADPWYMMRDVAEGVGDHVHTIYCQGDVQRDALHDRRGIPVEKLKLTGNPRVDLMREPFLVALEDEAQSIREQFGRFVLVNTNSGSINNHWGDLDRYRQILWQIGWADPNNPEDQLLVEDHIEHDRNNVLAVQAFVEEFTGRAPDVPVVLRPHPSEKSDPWIEFARRFDTVTVVSDSEPQPWLLAAELVVTTGCTTAAEAVVMGKDAISLVVQPDHVRHPAFFVANKVAHQETDAMRAAETAASVLRGDRRSINADKSGRMSVLSEHIFDGSDGPAFVKIGEHLVSLIRRDAVDDVDGGKFETLLLNDTLTISKVAWKKAYFSLREVRSRYSAVLKTLAWETDGPIRQIGHGTYLLSPVV